MEMISAKDLAREVARVLRHAPDQLGLVLEAEGWVSLDDLYDGFMTMTSYSFEFSYLREALESNNRGRFDLEGDRVRALKGHTTSQVSYKVAEPPEGHLYRVYSARHLNYLQDLGVQRHRKKYTRLFENPFQAQSDAKKRRIKNGVMVSIDAQQAYHDGTLFYLHDGNWYVEEVEPFHITLSELTIGDGS